MFYEFDDAAAVLQCYRDYIADAPEQLGCFFGWQIAPDLPFLIPGIGAQGGDLAGAILQGTDADGNAALVNSSRGIIYASSGEDFAEAARRECKKLRDDINEIRNKKRAS